MSWPRIVALSLALSLTLRPLSAQHAFTEAGATYDPRVPTPRAVLGYELGDRFTPQRLINRYIERIAAASPRVKVDTVARSFEGREMFLLTITSKANQGRLAALMNDAQRVADPRGAAPGEIDAAVRRLPAIVWLALAS